MSVVSDFVTEVYGCFVNVLTASPNKPAHIVIRPGIQVEPDLGAMQDQCCEGYAYVRLMGILAPEEPTRRSPLGTPISPCGMYSIGAQIELSIMRCAPTGDINFGPDDADWNNASAQLLTDQALMWKTLCCVRELFADRFQSWSIIFNNWDPWEVQGGCYGGRLQFAAELECPDGDCIG